MLKIKFLGKVMIEQENLSITENLGAKALALLSLLILHYPKSMQRDKLITYLWPDSSEESGKYNLRFNLWKINSSIGKDQNGNKFLYVGRNDCRINQNYKYECDILNIKKKVPYQMASISELENMRSILNGDFMEGFYFKNCNEYNEMIIAERNYYENQKIKILFRLIELYQKQRNFFLCEKIIKEFIILEPYDEEIALKIMEIYEENGKRSSAILFYKEFQKKLMISLGIQPSRELKQKYFSLKNMRESKNSSQSGINIQEKKRGYGRGNKVYLELSTTCISKLKYYWITSFLESLEDKIDFDFYISEIEKRDLGFIFSPFQKEGFSEQIPDVRIASAFLHLLGKLKIDYSIHVHIENYEDMDFFSSSLIKIVNQRKLFHILL